MATVPPMTRRLLLFGLLLGLLLTLAACRPSTTATTSAPIGTNPPGDPVTTTFIFDGDSFGVDLGELTDEVRLLGINAPEEDECFGDEARAALGAMIEGRDIYLDTNPVLERDQFGRLLVYAYVDGRNVNEAMLTEGHAVAVRGDHELNDPFVDAMENAAGKELGMWSPNACGPRTRRDIAIAWVEYNPPGPDDEALNDEYVEIINEGSIVVDLTGWTLRDESTQNRYVLDHQLPAGARVTVRSGCGADRREDVFWCSEQPVWSNGGDTAILQDEHGNVLAWRSYRGS